ncbi:MAG: hypothetical protein FWJ87_17535, partial [Micromonosporaceae bacterium]
MTARTVRSLVGFPLVLAGLAALALFDTELGVTTFYLTLLATMFFWVAQSTSWNILSGYSGYFSFGQGAFVGVGVYTAAVLTAKHGWNFLATLPVAAVLSTLLAAGIGAVAFRLGSFRGATFALLTLAVPFILLAVARVTRAIDGGQGIVVPVPDRPADLGFQQFQYLVTLVVAVLAVAAAYAIAHSRFGWALAAIRDNEDVAEQVGVATFRWKMAAIATCGFIGGLSGATWTLQLPYVTVESVFTLMVPLYVIVMSVLGGRTHWLGPVVGAAVIVLLQNRLASGGLDQWRLIIFGGLLAVMVVFAPEGLLARLQARPWPVLVAAVVGLAFVLVDPFGIDQLLDRLVWALLLVALVAFWPRRLLPGAWRRDAPGPAASPAPPASQAPSPPPPPSAGPGVAAPAPPAPTPPAGGRDPGTVPAAPRSGEPEAAREVVVECRGLARHYGGVRALDGVDLR